MVAARLMLVRHGESLGNVSATRASEHGEQRIDVPARDADVGLSSTGRDQAEALGVRLAAEAGTAGVDSVWVSPFARARQTAEVALATAGIDVPMVIDERLRDRDLGVLDALTGVGVEALYPEEATRRRWLGKFYHRPAGGESWTDVISRVRSVMRDLDEEEDGRSVLLVSHDAVVMSFRYVIERMDEVRVLDVARTSPVLNAALTRYVVDDQGNRVLDLYNDVTHLEESQADVTRHPGERHRHDH